jgi:hypothetical protein
MNQRCYQLIQKNLEVWVDFPNQIEIFQIKIKTDKSKTEQNKSEPDMKTNAMIQPKLQRRITSENTRWSY